MNQANRKLNRPSYDYCPRCNDVVACLPRRYDNQVMGWVESQSVCSRCGWIICAVLGERPQDDHGKDKKPEAPEPPAASGPESLCLDCGKARKESGGGERPIAPDTHAEKSPPKPPDPTPKPMSDSRD